MAAYDYELDEDLWREVRNTKEAIRARALLVLYTAALSAPFVAAVAAGAFLIGMEPHEVIGLSCYHAMISTLFFFDTLRNAAHSTFDEAQELGLVSVSKRGIPLIDPEFPHRRLALLSFAVGGRPVE